MPRVKYWDLKEDLGEREALSQVTNRMREKESISFKYIFSGLTTSEIENHINIRMFLGKRNTKSGVHKKIRGKKLIQRTSGTNRTRGTVKKN